MPGIARGIVAAVIGGALLGCGDSSGPQSGTQAPGSQVARLQPFQGPSELAVDLGGGGRMEFILIQPGAFMMGDDRQNALHEVTLTRAYYLGKYEVTQEQSQAVMGSNPSLTQGPKNPVHNLSWDDAKAFTQRLSERVPGKGFRLPTEAEWECACRAGTSTRWSCGDDPATLKEYGWFKDNSEGKPHPVGQKRANPWGFYDMHGNILEWCEDWFGPADAADQTDPRGPASGIERHLRGGAWSTPAGLLQSTFRWSYGPSKKYDNFGLRVAFTAQ